MGAFVSLVDLANSLQQDVVNAVGNHLIELAEGLVIERIGDHAPWSPPAAYSTPRSVVLSAAGRPLRNPKGLKVSSLDALRREFPDERLGVYLDEDERNDLAEWQAAQNPVGWPQSPVGNFPEPLCYPDPARRPVYGGNALTDYNQ
jgi:hypothetical protein